MPVQSTGVGLYSTRYVTDQSTLLLPRNWAQRKGTSQAYGILLAHGLGMTSDKYGMGRDAGDHPRAWADAGFAVLAVDHARINSFGDPDAFDALDDAYTYLTTTIGCQSAIGVMDWSMGGNVMWTWRRKNAAKIACHLSFAPLLDLDWARPTGGYTFGWGDFATYPSLNYAASIDPPFTPTPTVNGGVTVPQTPSSITVTINNAIGNMPADPTLSPNGYNSFWTGAARTGREIRYTTRDDTHLYGAYTPSGGTLALTNGQTLYGAYTDQSVGYRAIQHLADFAAQTIPTRIIHNSDDASIPQAQTNYAIAQINTSYVKMWSPLPGGGHTGMWALMDVNDTTNFWRTYLGKPRPLVADFVNWRMGDLKNQKFSDLATILG